MKEEVTRYVPILAIVTKDKELIPIFDPRVSFEKDDMFGERYVVDDDMYLNPIECCWDCKKHTVKEFIDVTIPNEAIFEIGDILARTASPPNSKSYKEVVYISKVAEINFIETDIEIRKGKKITNSYLLKTYPEITERPNDLFKIHIVSAEYTMTSGYKTSNCHSIFQLGPCDVSLTINIPE